MSIDDVLDKYPNKVDIKQALLEIILKEKPEELPTDNSQLGKILHNQGFNQCCDEYAKRLTDLFNKGDV